MWQRFAPTEVGTHLIYRSKIIVILKRKILTPYGWIFSVVRELNNPVERISTLLFAFEYVYQQPDHCRRCEHRNQEAQDEGTATTRPRRILFGLAHGSSFVCLNTYVQLNCDNER